MSEVIAALIIACTGLHDAAYDSKDKEKSACIKRVADCAELVTHLSNGDLDRTAKILKLCAKEVHL